MALEGGGYSEGDRPNKKIERKGDKEVQPEAWPVGTSVPVKCLPSVRKTAGGGEKGEGIVRRQKKGKTRYLNDIIPPSKLPSKTAPNLTEEIYYSRQGFFSPRAPRNNPP